MHESIVFCSACTVSSEGKFTFAISSPDEFLVQLLLQLLHLQLLLLVVVVTLVVADARQTALWKF